MDTGTGGAPGAPRVTNACEACRAAKVKCQASKQLGICRRCLESKRECVFKTGPRTRRPRQSKLNPSTIRPPPPPGPSKTFTIDVPLPRGEHCIDTLAMVRNSHEAFLEKLLPSVQEPNSGTGPEGDDDDRGSTATTTTSTTDGTPAFSMSSSASVTSSRGTTASSSSMSGLGSSSVALGMRRQPQFNLDSAAALLEAFRTGMAPYFPVASAVTETATIPELARDRPFVLLAVLAAASGARMVLQGHGSLYDEEFRKILGLKFVAGGERTVELLVGLLVYCAWYPVHLRPRSKQSAQYVRMAVDLVHDLELDRPDGPGGGDPASTNVAGEERLEGIRAYLACYYLVVARAVAWSRTPSLHFTSWTARCCEILETEGGNQPGDRILPWLVRYQHMIEEIATLAKAQERGHQSAYQTATMLRGLAAQFREWRPQVSAAGVATSPAVVLASSAAEIYLHASHLYKLPATGGGSGSLSSHRHLPDADAETDRMLAALPLLRAALEYVAGMPEAEFANFGNVDWCRFIFVVVISFRISFPLPVFPGWDHARAREVVELGRFLGEVCGPDDDDDDDRGGGEDDGEGEDDEEEGQEEDVEEDEGDDDRGGAPSSARKQRQKRQQNRQPKQPKKGAMTVLSASQVVFRVVKRKYDKRVSMLQPAPPPPPSPPPPAAAARAPPPPPQAALSWMSSTPMELDKSVRGCPMRDGSLDHYFPMWDEAFTDPSAVGAAAATAAAAAGQVGGGGAAALGAGMFGGGGGGGGVDAGLFAGLELSPEGGADGAGGAIGGQYQPQPMLFHDLWATMTMGWTQDDAGGTEF